MVKIPPLRSKATISSATSSSSSSLSRSKRPLAVAQASAKSLPRSVPSSATSSSSQDLGVRRLARESRPRPWLANAKSPGQTAPKARIVSSETIIYHNTGKPTPVIVCPPPADTQVDHPATQHDKRAALRSWALRRNAASLTLNRPASSSSGRSDSPASIGPDAITIFRARQAAVPASDSNTSWGCHQASSSHSLVSSGRSAILAARPSAPTPTGHRTNNSGSTAASAPNWYTYATSSQASSLAIGDILNMFPRPPWGKPAPRTPSPQTPGSRIITFGFNHPRPLADGTRSSSPAFAGSTLSSVGGPPSDTNIFDLPRRALSRQLSIPDAFRYCVRIVSYLSLQGGNHIHEAVEFDPVPFSLVARNSKGPTPSVSSASTLHTQELDPRVFASPSVRPHQTPQYIATQFRAADDTLAKLRASRIPAPIAPPPPTIASRRQDRPSKLRALFRRLGKFLRFRRKPRKQ